MDILTYSVSVVVMTQCPHPVRPAVLSVPVSPSVAAVVAVVPSVVPPDGSASLLVVHFGHAMFSVVGRHCGCMGTLSLKEKKITSEMPVLHSLGKYF